METMKYWFLPTFWGSKWDLKKKKIILFVYRHLTIHKSSYIAFVAIHKRQNTWNSFQTAEFTELHLWTLF